MRRGAWWCGFRTNPLSPGGAVRDSDKSPRGRVAGGVWARWAAVLAGSGGPEGWERVWVRAAHSPGQAGRFGRKAASSAPPGKSLRTYHEPADCAISSCAVQRRPARLTSASESSRRRSQSDAVRPFPSSGPILRKGLHRRAEQTARSGRGHRRPRRRRAQEARSSRSAGGQARGASLAAGRLTVMRASPSCWLSANCSVA